ncbi:MAG: hypothetical protein AB2804_00625 [Candidatus Thiodiazotropha endolucinida]|uniref:Uncharacterized protein n=1 Tax=Candidatus Thiodiazotropha endolucinida TaxID=1655433 RepID=A0A7Z1AG59_9GAMM|nr:hypothetical protein [Candidatus Thiodiazotropha endolucinida]ODJ88676.1 hypothetical protein CODIS_12270 [Candidatus Thiodiazotropha endolucinida]
MRIVISLYAVPLLGQVVNRVYKDPVMGRLRGLINQQTLDCR